MVDSCVWISFNVFRGFSHFDRNLRIFTFKTINSKNKLDFLIDRKQERLQGCLRAGLAREYMSSNYRLHGSGIRHVYLATYSRFNSRRVSLYG